MVLAKVQNGINKLPIPSVMRRKVHRTMFDAFRNVSDEHVTERPVELTRTRKPPGWFLTPV
jgi:hypothetical protein